MRDKAKYNAYMRRWRLARKQRDPEWWLQQNEYKRNWATTTGYDQRRDPEKIRARRNLQQAVRDGRIERQPCEVCGQPDAHAHHEDYSRPKDVRWLCPLHHAALHRGELCA